MKIIGKINTNFQVLITPSELKVLCFGHEHEGIEARMFMEKLDRGEGMMNIDIMPPVISFIEYLTKNSYSTVAQLDNSIRDLKYVHKTVEKILQFHKTTLQTGRVSETDKELI